MTRTPRHVLGLAATVALAFGLSACGASDVSQEKLADDLVEKSGFDEETADCVSKELFDNLDQSTLNDLYSENENEALSEEQEAAFTAAAEACVTLDTSVTTEAEG